MFTNAGIILFGNDIGGADQSSTHCNTNNEDLFESGCFLTCLGILLTGLHHFLARRFQKSSTSLLEQYSYCVLHYLFCGYLCFFMQVFTMFTCQQLHMRDLSTSLSSEYYLRIRLLIIHR